jgi:DnaK suppressor protein
MTDSTPPFSYFKMGRFLRVRRGAHYQGRFAPLFRTYTLVSYSLGFLVWHIARNSLQPEAVREIKDLNPLSANPKESVMKKETVMKFKSLFEEQRMNLTFTQKVIDQDLMVLAEDLLDEVDMSSAELDASMRMRLRNREALFAKKIDEALERIAHGTFGECEDCGENIELKRLEARPTATLCVSCKEESERKEHLHIDGHRFKSLGFRLKLA